MCGSMVDIQSATAEIRREKKKKDRKNKPLDENMSAAATQGGHNNVKCLTALAKPWENSHLVTHNNNIIIIQHLYSALKSCKGYGGTFQSETFDLLQ